jgi:phosphoglycerate dehydrogenase-like enzyme
MSRVLITSNFVQPGDETHRRLLDEGLEVIFDYCDGTRDDDEFIRLLQGIDGVIAGVDPFRARVLGSVPQLKVIARVGVGWDTVDLKAATENRIAVTINPGVNRHAVSEYSLALLLYCARRLKEGLAEIRNGGWTRYQGVELAGRTLGLIGLGTIGKEVAQRARAFEMRLLAHDSYMQDRQFAEEHGVTFVSLEELLRESDFVTLHGRLDAKTHHIINAETLALMKPTAYLINTARGGMVDTDALCKALKEKRIAGAALDVFEQEPLEADSPLFGLENAYISPHIAGSSDRAMKASAMESAENVILRLRGERPIYTVNPDVLGQ